MKLDKKNGQKRADGNPAPRRELVTLPNSFFSWAVHQYCGRKSVLMKSKMLIRSLIF